ncbi:MAG: hypothetical protein JW789_04865 [Candidatus Aenigmarchaeota archaeon]|nr:hypothetical protein [Candidatus Aenigmarchaeota archaeon]
MIIPFRPKRDKKRQAKAFINRMHDIIVARMHRIPRKGYISYFLKANGRKFMKASRYAAEDASMFLKRSSRYTESILFGILIVVASAILLTSSGESIMTMFIALLLMVMTVVLYAEFKLQRRMLRQYIPSIDLVRMRKCRLYSDRINVRNIFGAAEKINEMKLIRNIEIGYDIINDSFSPVSIDSAMLRINNRKLGVVSIKPEMSVLDVQPKKTSGTDVTFRLRTPMNFDDIKWVELEIKGNAKKRMRVKPHLFVNAMLRNEKNREIKEPFTKFMKHPEVMEMAEERKNAQPVPKTASNKSL